MHITSLPLFYAQWPVTPENIHLLYTRYNNTLRLQFCRSTKAHSRLYEYEL
jgi:hypothetical protein